jgi:hypothetical protein
MDKKKYEFPLQLKTIEENGYFAGYASVFNVEDNHNDIILSGAFGNSLSKKHYGKDIKLLWQHKSDEPIGTFTKLVEDEHGLLLRGRLGSENVVSTHEEGERFVLLDNLIFRAEMQKNLIGNIVNIKIVSFGQNINDMQAISMGYKAQNLVPYAIADLVATQDTLGDITFSWIRRSREFSTLRDYVDMPLSESFEEYKVEIIDVTDQIVRTLDINTNSAVYTASDQATDFGSLLSEVKVRVYQISETVGKGTETLKTFNF